MRRQNAGSAEGADLGARYPPVLNQSEQGRDELIRWHVLSRNRRQKPGNDSVDRFQIAFALGQFDNSLGFLRLRQRQIP